MVQNSTEESSSYKFKYQIVLDLREGGQYRLVRYNSPYKESEQELDDIQAMLQLPGYRIIDLTTKNPGLYKLEVECLFVPNSTSHDGTYDQVFKLLSMELISDGNSSN